MKKGLTIIILILMLLFPVIPGYAINTSSVELTDEEKLYIDSGPELKALCVFSASPYCTFRGDAAIGAIPELVRIIEARSGLNITIIDAFSNDEALRMIERGEVELILDAAASFDWAGEYGYSLTEPYLTASYSMLRVRNEETRTHSIAVTYPPSVAAIYAKQYYYPEQLVFFNSGEDCVEAVLGGNCDFAVLTSHMTERLVRDDEMNRFISMILPGPGESIGIAVNNRANPELFSILNKAVASFEDGLTDQAILRHTAHREGDMTLVAYFYRYPAVIFGIFILAILLGLMIFLIFLLIKRNNRVKAEHLRAEEEIRRNELLSDALALAERADSAKSQFLSRVSHEMRTPLNAIIGFMTLAKDADSEQMKRYLVNSEIAAKQLLAVINDVLDMSAIESGKVKIAHAPFDFRQLIHSITNIYMPQCDMKGIHFETRFLTPLDDWLLGDQLHLNQILINLLSNAVKFTDKGDICLKISQRDKKNNKVFIRFEVSDTGCGMSAEMQSRLFKSFEQENAMTAQKYGGSGLGLSIVKSLVTMMQGAIKVESKLKEGTTVIVDLPFEITGTEIFGDFLESMDELRVLIVDDEEAERDYLSMVLDRIGVRYTILEEGELTLAELERAEAAGDPYNICLIDWRMPSMSGIEVTRRIRDKYGKDVVVIIASAYEHYQVGDNARAAGANLFISKPLFQSSLVDLFMTLTNGRIGKKDSIVPDEYDFTDKRVLLVEDHHTNRIVAEGLLEKFGIKVDTAEDGNIAVDKFTESEPGYYDAILMDIQMPEMNGYEATEAIRKSDHPEAKSIQIIALTANAFNEDITRALSKGMNDHVAKPIDPKLLRKALGAAFSGKTDQ